MGKAYNIITLKTTAIDLAEAVIIRSHGYYAKLKANHNYRKRVTIFTKLSLEHEEKQKIVLVKYKWET